MGTQKIALLAEYTDAHPNGPKSRVAHAREEHVVGTKRGLMKFATYNL